MDILDEARAAVFYADNVALLSDVERHLPDYDATYQRVLAALRSGDREYIALACADFLNGLPVTVELVQRALQAASE